MRRIGFLAVLCLLVTSVTLTPGRAACDALEVKNFELESDTYLRKVVGEAVNTSGDTLTFAEVVFTLHSDTGPVGETFDHRTDLPAGATWNFSATVLTRSARRAELSETSCLREGIVIAPDG